MVSQRVSKREQVAVEAMRREREGTTGLVQCPGCPETSLVPDGPGFLDGMCVRHRNEVAFAAHGRELAAETWRDGEDGF